MAKKKKQTALYDENGRWVQERNQVKGAVRRVFRLSPQMKEVLQKSRIELPPALKKDGTPGKRPQVRYKCAMCRKLFPQKKINVDHIDPVVPVYKTEQEMSYDEIVRGIFCSIDNLQVLCSTSIKENKGRPSCHKIKTDEENFIRKKLTGKAWVLCEYDDIINKLKEEYKQHLKDKEDKILEREKKKREREEKRRRKNT